VHINSPRSTVSCFCCIAVHSCSDAPRWPCASSVCVHVVVLCSSSHWCCDGFMSAVMLFAAGSLSCCWCSRHVNQDWIVCGICHNCYGLLWQCVWLTLPPSLGIFLPISITPNGQPPAVRVGGFCNMRVPTGAMLWPRQGFV
jgi:hypothetical protein